MLQLMNLYIQTNVSEVITLKNKHKKNQQKEILQKFPSLKSTKNHDFALKT